MDKLVSIVGIALLANINSPFAYKYGWEDSDDDWDQTQSDWYDHKHGRQNRHDQGWHHNHGLHNSQEGWQKSYEECQDSHEGWQYLPPDWYDSHELDESHQGKHGQHPHGQKNWSINDPEKRTPIKFPEDPDDESLNPLDILECMYYCPLSQKDEPVCGTNSFTYGNIGKLQCAKKCGIEVDFAHWGTCARPGSHNKNPDIGRPDMLNTHVTASNRPDITQCALSCQTTPEYNPVCGTDYEMYENLGKLECVRKCGINVQLLRRGSCPQSTPSIMTTSSTKPVLPVTQTSISGDQNGSDQTIRQCIRSCRTTPEYSPVCGTNMVKYDNIGRLQCAKICGINVAFLQFGNCPSSVPIVETMTTPSITPSTAPTKNTLPPELSFDVRLKEEIPPS